MTEGKSSEPIISVVVPIYNAVLYLESCLNSILDQHLSEDELEVIMVNDGSTDGSQLIAQKYAERYPSFHLINQANAGLSVARNVGIDHARGKYLHFLDSDDVLAPDAYRDSIAILERTESDLITSPVMRFTSTHRHWAFQRIADLMRQNYENICLEEYPQYIRDFLAWNKIYRRSFFLNTNVIFPEGRIYEDIATSPLIYLSSKSFDVYNKPVVYWRMTNGSITQTTNSAKLYDRLWAIESDKRYLIDKNTTKNIVDEFDFGVIDYNLRWIFLDLYKYDQNVCMPVLQSISEIMQDIDKQIIDRVVEPLREWAYMAKNRQFDELMDILKHGPKMPNSPIDQIPKKRKAFVEIVRFPKKVFRKVKRSITKFTHHTMWLLRKVPLYFVWYPIFRHLPLKKNTALFSSYWGRQFKISDGPPSVAIELSKANKDFEIIICATGANLKKVQSSADELLAESVNTKVVKVGSRQYYNYFWRAKYLFNDVNFGENLDIRFVKKRSGQIEIQTTHGTALKKMGLDSEDAVHAKQRAIFQQKTKRYDYLVASSPVTAGRIMQANNSEAKVLKTGLPQNDFLFIDRATSDLQALKEKYGLDQAKKIVVYAPTFRYDRGYAFRYLIDFNKLRDLVGDDYQVLIKIHPYNHTNLSMIDFRELTDFGSGMEKEASFIRLFGEIRGMGRQCSSIDLDKLQWSYYPRIRTIDADINELMLVSDMMITDYSSTMFNYPHLNKPLIFFIPDADFYNSTRGLYDNIEDIAFGAVVKNTEELGNAIKLADDVVAWYDKYGDKAAAFKEMFLSYETGNASRKILEEIGILKPGDVNGGEG